MVKLLIINSALYLLILGLNCIFKGPLNLYENGVVIDLTRVASSPDQRPKTELKSNSDVFTNGGLEMMVSNESLTGSNPTIYSVEVKITNIISKVRSTSIIAFLVFSKTVRILLDSL